MLTQTLTPFYSVRKHYFKSIRGEKLDITVGSIFETGITTFKQRLQANSHIVRVSVLKIISVLISNLKQCEEIQVKYTNCFYHHFVFGCGLHMYRRNSLLCIDGKVIFSQEGATQGNLLEMIIYSIITLPLVHHLAESTSARQVWFAYDAMAGGQLQCVKDWWDELKRLDPILAIMQMPPSLHLL